MLDVERAILKVEDERTQDALEALLNYIKDVESEAEDNEEIERLEMEVDELREKLNERSYV